MVFRNCGLCLKGFVVIATHIQASITVVKPQDRIIVRMIFEIGIFETILFFVNVF